MEHVTNARNPTPTAAKAQLVEKAEAMKQELLKAAEKVKENPNVKKAFDTYDQQMAQLKAAMDSDAAQKVFQTLTTIKEQIVAVIQAVANSAAGQAALAKVNEIQANAQARLDEYKALAKAKI